MSELVGQTLVNRYQVDAFIGRGGMAEVSKVWDIHRSTVLAMKILHADLALDRVFLRRFRREAQTLARLQHPNIVRFYALEQDGHQVFMLMDYVQGESLKTRIFDANGPMPLQQVMNVVRPLCQALQYAHNEGFIHADVKPGNVLIDETGRVMLSDFGVARMTESATATMMGAGTPAYMSPEQARGESPTMRSDIYSLGIVLYEMLTGQRPFTGEHAKIGPSNGDKVRWEQINLRPPSPRTVNPTISLGLEAVVLRCLRKEPAGRVASALEVYRRMETPSQITPRTPIARAQRAKPGAPVMHPRVPEASRRRQSRMGWLATLALIAAVLGMAAAVLIVPPLRSFVLGPAAATTPTVFPQAQLQPQTPLLAPAREAPTFGVTDAGPRTSLPEPGGTVGFVQGAVLTPAHVREGPGTTYVDIDGLYAGQSFTALARNADGTWLLITYVKVDPLNVDGLITTGWINTALATLLSGDVNELPVKELPPLPRATPTPTSTGLLGPWRGGLRV